MKFQSFLLIFLTFISLGCKSTQPQSGITNTGKYTGPKIDMHLHTGLPHEVPPNLPSLCRPEPCKGDGKSIVNSEELMKSTLEEMDRNNITLAFLSGVDWNAVQEWKESSPARFIASPFILKPGEAHLAKLKQEYEQGRFTGMGEIGVQLNGIPPNDSLMAAYFKLAEDRDIPVLIHTLGIGPYMPHFKSASGNPLLLEEVLSKHPKLRIFVENAGFPFREEMIAMMYQYPNLYADVSTITWVIPRSAFYDHLEAFMRAGLGKRIMFGSDQMVWPHKISAAVEAIEEAPFLSMEQKQDIFYNNAARFLRLSDSMEYAEDSSRKH